MNFIYIIAQIPTALPEGTIEAIEAIQSTQSEGLSVGAFIGGLLIIILGGLKVVAPAIANRYVKNLATSAEKEQHEFQKDQEEDSLSISARSFLDEQARESIASVRTIAENCQEQLEGIKDDKFQTAVELARLQERDLLRQETLDQMKGEQKETNQLLRTYQSDMATMQGQVRTLTTELTTTKRKVSELESKLKTSEENREELAAELEFNKSQVATMAEELDGKTNIINQLRTKIIEYRASNGKGSLTDTDELLSLVEDE